MPGSLSRTGARAAMNNALGIQLPVVSGSAPTWKPGMWWIDTGSGNAIKRWNGSSWVVDSGVRYLALLFSGPAENATLAALDEIVTSGYARVSVTLDFATDADPTIVLNTNLITFGPMSVDMTVAATHAALVDVPSGTTGQVLYTWELDVAQQVNASQTIQVAIGQLSAALS